MRRSPDCVRPHPGPFGSIISTVAACIWLVWLIHRQVERVRSYRAGRKGEA